MGHPPGLAARPPVGYILRWKGGHPPLVVADGCFVAVPFPHGGALITPRVKPEVHVITLAVDDLDRALRFYRDGLGFQSEGITATEFERDERSGAGAIAMFRLSGGLILSIYPRDELAHDAKVPLMAPKSGEFSIGQLVDSRDAVDATLSLAEAAGATITDKAHDRPFGIYSGYFTDPDGHLWEIIWNPARNDG